MQTAKAVHAIHACWDLVCQVSNIQALSRCVTLTMLQGQAVAAVALGIALGGRSRCSSAVTLTDMQVCRETDQSGHKGC